MVSVATSSEFARKRKPRGLGLAFGNDQVAIPDTGGGSASQAMTSVPSSNPVTSTLPRTTRGLGTAANSNQPQHKTVAELTAEYASKDSPLMTLARTQGAQLANRRGLLNSSIASQASMDSILGVAVPMASQDSQQSLTRAENQLDRSLQERMQGRDISSREKISFAQIESSEGIAAAQRALDRELQATALSHADQQQIRDIASREGMAAADRALQEKLTLAEIGSREKISLADIASREGIAQAQMALDERLQAVQLDHNTQAQIRDIASREGMAEADRALDQALAELDVDSRERIALAQIESTEGLAEAERALDRELQNASLAAADEQQIRDIAAREGMAAADRALQETLQNRDFAFETEMREQDRQLQERIAGMNLNSDDRNAASQLMSNMLGQYATDFQTIMSNPNLSADDRTAQLESIKNFLDTRLSLVEQQYQVDLDWGLPGENDFTQGQATARIEQLYQQHLGRSPDLGGLDFWAAELANGTRTLEDIEAEFIRAAIREREAVS